MASKPNTTPPTIQDVLGEINAGVYMQQVEAVFKQVALAVINHGDKAKKGKIKLNFELTRFGNDSGMVNVASSWQFEQPSMRGNQTEKNTTDMPFCVSKEGYLTVYPLEQTDMFGAGGNVTQFREQK